MAIWPKGYSTKEYRIWKEHNPGLKLTQFTAWRDQQTEFTLQSFKPVLSKEEKDAIKVAKSDGPTVPKKIAQSFKSNELKNFEQTAKINAGRPGYRVYKIDRAGNHWYRGELYTNTPEAVGAAFGGGRFEIRTFNFASNLEEVGEAEGKSVIIAISPAAFPPEEDETDLKRKALKAEEEEDGVSQDEMEKIIKDAQEKEELKYKLQLAEMKASMAPAANNNLADLAKLAEIIKLMSPQPVIGEKNPTQSMAENMKGIIEAVAAVATGGLGIWALIKKQIPAPVPTPDSGILSMLVQTVGPALAEGMKAKMAERGADREVPAELGQARPTPEQIQQQELEDMISKLVSQIEQDFKTNVSPTATANYIRAQGGMVKMFVDQMSKETLLEVITKAKPELFYPSGDVRQPDKLAFDWAAKLVESVKGQSVSNGAN